MTSKLQKMIFMGFHVTQNSVSPSLVKIWDYQNKNCVQTLEGHSQNVNFASFHPELPIIISGSEDGTVRIWNSDTYRLENSLNYGLERAWCIAYQKGGNNVALGYDEGSVVIKLGREEPAVSMDASGKIIWAKHSEIQTANIKTGVGLCRYQTLIRQGACANACSAR